MPARTDRWTWTSGFLTAPLSRERRTEGAFLTKPSALCPTICAPAKKAVARLVRQIAGGDSFPRGAPKEEYAHDLSTASFALDRPHPPRRDRPARVRPGDGMQRSADGPEHRDPRPRVGGAGDPFARSRRGHPHRLRRHPERVLSSLVYRRPGRGREAPRRRADRAPQ